MTVISCLLGLAAAEAGVRLFCRTDLDGNRFFGNLQLKPYHLPVLKTRQLVDRYRKEIASAITIYDSDLGWKPNPGMAGFNREGFNSTELAPSMTHPGVLRVEVFGASYNRGWWKDMETQLEADGVKAEVLDFGVGGYGIDQSYLRWKKQGAGYQPDIVVLACCLGTIYDNTNIFRLLRLPQSGIPFAKPRFIVSGSGLELVSGSLPPPEELAGVMSGLEQWPLLRYEPFYRPADYVYSPLRHLAIYSLIESKLACLGDDTLRYVSNERSVPPRYFTPDREAVNLSLELVKAFRKDVENHHTRFFMVNLPSAADLAWYRSTGSFPYAGLYASMQKIATVINVEDEMLHAVDKKNTPSMFSGGHYSRELQGVVGRAAASYLVSHEIKTR